VQSIFDNATGQALCELFSGAKYFDNVTGLVTSEQRTIVICSATAVLFLASPYPHFVSFPQKILTIVALLERKSILCRLQLSHRTHSKSNVSKHPSLCSCLASRIKQQVQFQFHCSVSHGGSLIDGGLLVVWRLWYRVCRIISHDCDY
jgi:hypothetical protein